MLRNLLQNPALMLKFIVSILYTFMGILFLTVREVIQGFTGPLAIMLGCVLLIYGLFRFFRAWNELKVISKQDE